jgi:hypothetical protein
MSLFGDSDCLTVQPVQLYTAHNHKLFYSKFYPLFSPRLLDTRINGPSRTIALSSHGTPTSLPYSVLTAGISKQVIVSENPTFDMSFPC